MFSHFFVNNFALESLFGREFEYFLGQIAFNFWSLVRIPMEKLRTALGMNPSVSNVVVSRSRVPLSQILHSFLFYIPFLYIRGLFFGHFVSNFGLAAEYVTHNLVFYRMLLQIFNYLLILVFFSVKVMRLLMHSLYLLSLLTRGLRVSWRKIHSLYRLF